MSAAPRTLPTSAPPWTDADAARDVEAVKHGHPPAGWYILTTSVLVYGPNDAVLSIPVRSEPQWMDTSDARTFVRHPSDTVQWSFMGRTKEGAQI